MLFTAFQLVLVILMAGLIGGVIGYQHAQIEIYETMFGEEGVSVQVDVETSFILSAEEIQEIQDLLKESIMLCTIASDTSEPCSPATKSLANSLLKKIADFLDKIENEEEQ